jgi:hypothetical protein
MRSKWIGMSVATIVAVSCSFALAQRGGAGAGGNIGAGANVGGAGPGANIGAGTNAGANVGGPINVGAGANVGPRTDVGAGANVGRPGVRAEGRLDTGNNVGTDRGERWRFRFDNGRWWYWSPENRWSYYDNNNWTEYQGGQGYTANYAPDMSGGTGDCTTPAGGYGALPNADQNGYVTGLDPRYRFDNGQWYYQTDNGWLAYNDGQWVEPRGTLPGFIANGRGIERGQESDAQREGAREADLRGRPNAGTENRGERESTPGRSDTRERTESREQPGRNEPARGENAPSSGRNESDSRR